MSGYRDRHGPRFTIGIVPGAFAAFIFSYEIGVPILFGAAWGCVPAHRPPELEPCGGWELWAALGTVGAGMAVTFLAVRWVADRLVALLMRRSE